MIDSKIIMPDTKTLRLQKYGLSPEDLMISKGPIRLCRIQRLVRLWCIRVKCLTMKKNKEIWQND
jgi:hypothetical protein